MKTFLHLVICITFLILYSCSRQNDTIVLTEEIKNAQLNTVFDLGTITNDRIYYIKFFFENKLNLPIDLESTRTSCGCTTLLLDKNQLKPNEKHQFTIEYKPFNKLGSNEEMVFLSAKTDTTSNLILKVKAQIENTLQIDQRTVLLDHNNGNLEDTVNIDCKNDFIVKSIDKPNHIDCNLKEGDNLKNINNFSISCNNDSPSGYYKLAIFGEEEGQELKIDIDITEKKIFETSPSMLNVVFQNEQTVNSMFALRPILNDININDVEHTTNLDCISKLEIKEENNNFLLHIEVEPPANKKFQYGYIELRLKESSQ